MDAYLIKYQLGYLLSSFECFAVGNIATESRHITNRKVSSSVALLSSSVTYSIYIITSEIQVFKFAWKDKGKHLTEYD